jgi:hypothetical protein
VDGLCRAAFPGGYTISFMIADVATGKAKEFWHNQPNDRTFNGINSFQWADGPSFHGAAPQRRVGPLLSVSIDSPQPEPVLLTTTDGLINDSVAGSHVRDDRVLEGRQDLHYCTNAKDIGKRHIWAVPTQAERRFSSTDDGASRCRRPRSRLESRWLCCTSTPRSPHRSASCPRPAAARRSSSPR